MAMPPASSGHDYIGTAANQVYIRLGQPAISRSNPDYDTFLVLNQILGGSGAFESRLWQELRQKRGLVYSVDSSLDANADRGDLSRRTERFAAARRRSGEASSVANSATARPSRFRRPNCRKPKCGWSATRCSMRHRRADRRSSCSTSSTNGLPLDYYRTLNERFARITAADVQRVAAPISARTSGRSLRRSERAHGRSTRYDRAPSIRRPAATLERIALHGRADRSKRSSSGVERGARPGRRRRPSERAALLRAVAARLREQCDALADTAVREMGKPHRASARRGREMRVGLRVLRRATAAAMLATQAAPSTAARSYVAFRPLGVVLAIMPWNFPYWQVVPRGGARADGRQCRCCSSTRQTRRAARSRSSESSRKPGRRTGFFATLLVTDEEVDELIADPRIAAVTLTGSERAGVAVARAAGEALKKCVLELGGSDAFVVLADADLGCGRETAVKARFQNNGQSCIAAKRFIVEAPVYDEFLERFVAARAAEQIVGDPMDERRAARAVCARRSAATVHEQVAQTLERGARLALGGKPIDAPDSSTSRPIVADVRPGMRDVRRRGLRSGGGRRARRRSPRARVALANESPFGLGFSIWTRDIARAERLAARVEAGNVFINGMVASDPRLPFGGVKKSGYGRELSAFGIHEFANIQTVWIGTVTRAIPTIKP